MTDDAVAPSIDAIRAAKARLGDLVIETPVRRLEGVAVERRLGATQVFLKEELFQRTGSFKPRGALTVMMGLSPEVLARGVVTLSAGNHAMATAYAARVLGTSAIVLMPENADPGRIQGARDLGAEVELGPTIHHCVARAQAVAATGRTLVHPFEGPGIALGTATVGLELMEQVRGLDAVIVPIGGGGLCAGIAAAVKQLDPRCAVYGVEPTGADTMTRSFAAGSPQSIDAVRTIADSLGAPFALPYSFALCRRYVDDLVLVDDEALRDGMRFLAQTAKLVVEPAGAAATAALLGPLRERLDGKRVGIIVCGGNVAVASFARLVGT